MRQAGLSAPPRNTPTPSGEEPHRAGDAEGEHGLAHELYALKPLLSHRTSSGSSWCCSTSTTTLLNPTPKLEADASDRGSSGQLHDGAPLDLVPRASTSSSTRSQWDQDGPQTGQASADVVMVCVPTWRPCRLAARDRDPAAPFSFSVTWGAVREAGVLFKCISCTLGAMALVSTLEIADVLTPAVSWHIESYKNHQRLIQDRQRLLGLLQAQLDHIPEVELLNSNLFADAASASGEPPVDEQRAWSALKAQVALVPEVEPLRSSLFADASHTSGEPPVDQQRAWSDLETQVALVPEVEPLNSNLFAAASASGEQPVSEQRAWSALKAQVVRAPEVEPPSSDHLTQHSAIDRLEVLERTRKAAPTSRADQISKPPRQLASKGIANRDGSRSRALYAASVSSRDIASRTAERSAVPPSNRTPPVVRFASHSVSMERRKPKPVKVLAHSGDRIKLGSIELPEALRPTGLP